MVCEDESVTRLALAQQLEKRGYRVLCTETTAGAKALFQDGLRVHLLITDVMVSDGADGIDLADWVRKTHPEVPIVLITAWLSRGLPTIFDAQLIKPFTFQELLTCVSGLLRKPSSGEASGA